MTTDQENWIKTGMKHWLGGGVLMSDLCGLDHSEVIDSVEAGSHRRSESGRSKAHPAAESRPQIVQPSGCQQRLHLSPCTSVLHHRRRTPSEQDRLYGARTWQSSGSFTQTSVETLQSPDVQIWLRLSAAAGGGGGACAEH